MVSLGEESGAEAKTRREEYMGGYVVLSLTVDKTDIRASKEQYT
jgi:hypothetical protein